MSRTPIPLPTRIPRTKREWAVAVVLVLLALAVWWWQQRADAPEATPVQPDRPSASASVIPDRHSVDPASGLPLVTVGELPAEAEETLDLIDDGGPYPYDRDGVTFGNFEGILPEHERGYYREYTVPTPGEDDRGARRIVTGGPDEFFWTSDHYESFARIDR